MILRTTEPLVEGMYILSRNDYLDNIDYIQVLSIGIINDELVAIFSSVRKSRIDNFPELIFWQKHDCIVTESEVPEESLRKLKELRMKYILGK